MHLGIDCHSILVGFGVQVWLEKQLKTDVFFLWICEDLIDFCLMSKQLVPIDFSMMFIFVSIIFYGALRKRGG